MPLEVPGMWTHVDMPGKWRGWEDIRERHLEFPDMTCLEFQQKIR